MQVLGEITLIDKRISQPSIHDAVQQEGNSQTSQKTDERQSSLLQTKNRKKYNVKLKSDKETCNILSACTLDGGTIILSDNGNSKLKRVYPGSFLVKDSCNVPDYPHQVCAITNTEVAVSCSTSQLIQFVSVETTMKKASQIKTGKLTSGLAYTDGKLFVSGSKYVYVYTVSGDKLQHIDIDGLGASISRLAVNRDNLNIYVSSNHKGLMILDRNGSSIGGFNGPELKNAYDVCLHNSGSVLVCGHDSMNILQFSPVGTLIGEVLKSDKCFKALCFDKNNSKLVVGYLKDEIEVYDIGV